MKAFKNFILEQKNLHMEHIEDLIFLEGIEGTRKAIFFLRDLRDMLKGNAKRSITLTVKYDGAPSLFAGVDPEDGKFFVAKKGLFAKTPKLYKTQSDIDKELSGELREKFSIALNEFKKLGIKSGVYQGDLMFTSNDIQTKTIDGEKYITFQPNTIVYAIPENSNLAKEILKAKIGIVWHTSYEGESIQNLKSSFGKDIKSKMKQTSSVWMDDATYKDYSGTVTFTESESKKFDRLLSNIGSSFQKMNGEAFRTITADEELKKGTLTFINTYIRSNTPFPLSSRMVTEYLEYLDSRYQKEIDKRKTQSSKENWKRKRDLFKNKILSNRNQIVAMFDLMKMLAEAKEMVLQKLNNASNINTFLRTKDGFKVTNQEGFVAIDRLEVGAVKLVDRFEFSHANFSPEILKGWER